MSFSYLRLRQTFYAGFTQLPNTAIFRSNTGSKNNAWDCCGHA